MSRNYKISDQSKLHFISFSTVNWIDVFTRPAYKDIVVESLNYCVKNKGLKVYAWCIMSNHVHLIIGSETENQSGIIRDLKKHTSKTIIKAISDNLQESRKEWMLWMFERAGKLNSNNETCQFWQQHNQPIELNSNFLMDQKLNYIHNNPVEAGFVYEAQDYPYSSAIDYAGGKGMAEIMLLS
ncbi:REP-associated tyrosine transposase [Pontibacter anaerobius]|uniref:Transposase n=1 Tax=Pontibacter anaerobius TaxID=2993940 RepID=A0ABT3RDF8_9BACT|nr:transposase [Pontibacter anaerobius]MCX2739479.1 transposase [Pontibacter anaerobius]